MECGFISGKSATVRMLSRRLAVLPKESPDGVSGEVVHGDKGKRGQVKPDPEMEKWLLRESTPFWGHSDAG